MRKRICAHRRRAAGPAVARLAAASAAAAVGALAIGTMVIGSLAIKRLALLSGRIHRLSIDDLEIGKLTVREEARGQG
jgi:hypothetical protein